MHTTRDEILDRITPDEAHLPPAARTWARIIRLSRGFPALEIRDPNSGTGCDPAERPRTQYLVMGDRLWRRHLPPAALSDEQDETPWRDEPLRWHLVEPSRIGLPWEWAALRPYPTTPQRVGGEWDLHSNGDCATVGYVMPPCDPWDVWAAVTDAPCPHPDCDHTLVWHEAGYVPGYRVCAARTDSGCDLDTIRHRWILTHGVLVLDE